MHMVAAMEEVLCEVSDHEKRNAQGLPPGFRFHPTDEELITFYLAAKVFNATFSSSDVNFVEVDLNRCEPWELPEVAKMGEREWYLYSVRDRKYPTGLRTNRATGAGYWKATGKDKEVYTNSGSGPLLLIGMKKTLVFYKGRAPRGLKTRWVMHEYRLDGPFSHSHSHSLALASSTIKEEWVICRIFHKSGEKRSPPPPLVQGGHHHQLDYPSSPITTNKAAGALLELDSYHQSQSQQQLLHDAFQLASPFPNHASADQQLFFNNKSQPLQHLSQQKCTDALNTIKVKDEESTAAVPKVTKTDHHQPTPLFFPPYQQQLLDDPNNLNYWVDRLNPSSFQNSNSNSNSNSNIPLLVDHQIVDGGLMVYSSSGAETETANANAQVIIRDMPSSMAFNRAAGLQQHILAVESWPHPPHHL